MGIWSRAIATMVSQHLGPMLNILRVQVEQFIIFPINFLLRKQPMSIRQLQPFMGLKGEGLFPEIALLSSVPVRLDFFPFNLLVLWELGRYLSLAENIGWP